MIHLVTSCGPGYSRPWLFPTLGTLVGKRITALLHPSDTRSLLPCTERVLYSGDRFYQDGQFLDFVQDVSPEDTVVLADADALIQRDLTLEESQLLSLGGGFAAGYNRDSTQLGGDELKGLRLQHSLEDTARRFGVSPDDLTKCQMYNWGLVAAKASSWDNLKFLYNSMRGDRDPQEYFEGVAWMQYLLCVILHREKIHVTPMPLEVHSHEHYGLNYAHSISDRTLYYRGTKVFFAHYVRGVTHGRDVTRIGVKTPPHVVWHVACMGNWRVVATEQLALLRRVELTEVDCTYAGNLSELPWLLEEANNHQVRLNVVAKDQSLKVAETMAMAYVNRLAKELKTDRPIMYLHTKGVSRPEDPQRWKWRRALQKTVVECWKENLVELEGKDAVGFNWNKCDEPHFSGNFWIASPGWIRKLPEFKEFYALQSKRSRPPKWDAMPRFVCEYWIGAGPNMRWHSLGATNQVWEKMDFDALLETYEEATPRPRTWITSSASTYDRQWVWDSLHHLKDPVIACLHPDDELTLPNSITRVDYFGDRWFYDGQVIPHQKDVPDDEVVVLFDVDAVFQRSPHEGELDPPCDGFAAGSNVDPREQGAKEFSMLVSRFSTDEVSKRVGIPVNTMRTAPIYNLGLVSARGSTWRYLRYLYVRHVCKQGPELFGNLHFQQFLVCSLIAHYNIPVRRLGYETHSHGHFPLQREHGIKDGKMYYNGNLVLFAHNVKGVTH